LSLFEGEQKHTVFLSIPLNANELLFRHSGRSFNSLCPFTSHTHTLNISKTFCLLCSNRIQM